MSGTLTGHTPADSELPKGWEESTLGNVAEFVRGVTYKKADARNVEESGYMPLLRATNISSDSISFNEFVFVPRSLVKSDKRLQQNDLIIATSSGSISVVGKSAPVIQEFDGTFGAFCAVLRPSSALVPRYMHLFAQSPAVREIWSNLARGTNINNLKSEQVLSTCIPIPPLAEQEQIVEILEEQLSRLDAAVESVWVVRKKAAQFRRSLLHAAFTGTLTGHTSVDGELPKGWEHGPLNAFCEMYQPKTISTKDLIEGGEFPVYGANGQIGFFNEFNHPESEVTVTCRGATCGTVNVIPAKSWITGNAMVVRPTENSMSKPFLSYELQAINMGGAITGTAQPQITRTTLSPLQVVVPPLAEQERIVEILEEQLSRLDAALALADGVEKRSEALRRSLLHAAFTGRLTEQWREQTNV